MQIGIENARMEATVTKRASGERNRRFTDIAAEAESFGNSIWNVKGSRLQEKDNQGNEETERKAGEEAGTDGKLSVVSSREEQTAAGRSEAEKIYQAAISGKPNPIGDLREAPKVPYGYLAKDGTIVYNGVCFVCDEKTNSICLGDMTDTKNVLNIALSGGGHLKVNRNSIGLLSKASGMFSPEDLNLIMRAISQDTKIQSMKKEIEDQEASVGNQITDNGGTSQAEDPASSIQDNKCTPATESDKDTLF